MLFAYFGPDSLLPLTSGLAALAGGALFFGRTALRLAPMGSTRFPATPRRRARFPPSPDRGGADPSRTRRPAERDAPMSEFTPGTKTALARRMASRWTSQVRSAPRRPTGRACRSRLCRWGISESRALDVIAQPGVERTPRMRSPSR